MIIMILLKCFFSNFLFKNFLGYASSFTGRFALTDTGTFGPFQVCEQHGYLRICHNSQKIDLEGTYIYNHITYRYIDPSCHNFENCLLPQFVSQSCLADIGGTAS